MIVSGKYTRNHLKKMRKFLISLLIVDDKIKKNLIIITFKSIENEFNEKN